MVLLFGGTTEGRKAAEVLEEAGKPYYYSTKTGEQQMTLHHGIRIDGAMNADGMRTFCQQHQIRLIVNAAHPFAAQLHATANEVAATLQIPVVRYERIYPPRDPSIVWIDDYSQIPTDIHSLIATTGVQSISKLKYLETRGVKVIYRILKRESSIQLAHQQGATDDKLCFYPEMVDADAVLMKESGESGGFSEKVAEAKARSMRIIALKRPAGLMDDGQWVVNGPYGLRRAVEKLLPEFYPLHSGLTTGTCATAAAIAATLRLLKGETPDEVPVILPNGETIMVAVGYDDGYAYCIKEAGDDPDVTNGLMIGAMAEHTLQTEDMDMITIEGGEGVGTFTLPGFDYPPGEAAINKGPREMMVKNLAPFTSDHTPLTVTIFVPQGREIARRTFNPRLGIEGGISIIGVSGIVKPFSEEAFVDSIRKCMQVAKASGAGRVVINSGGKSERFVRAYYPDLPQQAFVEYGNYIGETLKMADELHFEHVVLGIMMGKAVKLAEGHLDTHSRKAVMNKQFVGKMLREAGIDCDISDMTLARELWERIPADRHGDFCKVVVSHCMQHCRTLLTHSQLDILLISEEGNIF